jgi:hypothetical protein
MGKKKNSSVPYYSKWRDFLDKFHVYGGLFISVYLIILGISSLHMQHHFQLPEGSSVKSWEKEINMPEILDNQAYKLAVRDSLGLFGGTPWWEDYRDDNGVHHFMITRPGKKYWVEVPTDNNIFKIEESRTGFLNVAMALHGLTGGELKGPVFIRVWKFFGQIMNIVFFIVLCITVYFWFIRSFKTYRGWIFAGSFVFSAIIILIFIWLVG